MSLHVILNGAKRSEGSRAPSNVARTPEIPRCAPLGMTTCGMRLRDQIERIAPQRQSPPHAAEHFLALLLLAGEVLVAVRAVA
jgi:hypothetical protein